VKISHVGLKKGCQNFLAKWGNASWAQGGMDAPDGGGHQAE